MFWASLCPSSGVLDHMLLHMVYSTRCASWSLGNSGSRPCVLCAHGLLPGFPRLHPTHLVLKLLKMGIVMSETC